MSITLRKPIEADAPDCARIIFEAFGRLSDRHNFPRDFASADMAMGMAQSFIAHPSIFGVVAEVDGKIVGSNFLDERDAIRAVGPITVNPNQQAKGVGRRLMEAVIERGRGAPGIRLVQEAYNTTSMPLYASLGFDVKEPLVLITGRTKSKPSAGAEVRPLREEDLQSCAALCRELHRFDRTNELREAIKMFRPTVLLRGGKVVAYASAPSFWLLNHGVARSEQDMKDLLIGTSANSAEPIALLLPTRQASFFRWALSEGLRVVKPLTLMTMGEYHEPRGCFYPSVQY